jgi:hypothetical protein
MKKSILTKRKERLFFILSYYSSGKQIVKMKLLSIELYMINKQ